MFIDVKNWPLLRDWYNVFAFFHTEGRQPSLYEVFKISWTGLVSRSVFSLSSHSGISSGPWALVGLIVESFFNTEAAVKINVDSEGSFESRVGSASVAGSPSLVRGKPSLALFEGLC